MKGPSLLVQVTSLARRSTLRTLRQPAVMVSAILFPLMFFAINTYGLDAATSIPGFPADSYLDFAFAFPLVQAALFGAITAGADLARDIESGFFDRLSLTPMRPSALLLGMLAGVVALGFGGIGAMLALRTGSVEAVESAFPLFFVSIFMSSINLPRDLIEQDWFRYIATANPISYLVEGLRSLVITGWDVQALLLGFGCAFAIIALSVAGASALLRTRVAR